MTWSFFIDVGGTFTDVIATTPGGRVRTMKILSSGVVRGTVGEGSTATAIVDATRLVDPDEFWKGFTCTLIDSTQRASRSGNSTGPFSTRIASFDRKSGTLALAEAARDIVPGQSAYELHCPAQAPIVAIRYLMGLRLDEAIGNVRVRLGTTRATNALLERRGVRTALVTTAGFGDILKIGYQDRPDLFALNIDKREELAERAIEIDERIDASGASLRTPDKNEIRARLRAAKADGIEALAVCFLHAHKNPDHERLVAKIASRIGFAQISLSSDVSPLQRIVHRGDTTVVDAYLGPVIRAYVESIRRSIPEATLQLMTSAGGLVDASAASGKDTILSGPAGGVVGCAYVAGRAGIAKAIAFDMGGTSTDVSRIDAEREVLAYTNETVKAGVHLMTPMLSVDTVAAGGGSVCAFDGQMLTVGPRSAGADPGPACYGRGGPLTITDVNLYLGRIVPEHFPFRLSMDAVEARLRMVQGAIERTNSQRLSLAGIADGFRRIANARMAGAIRAISTSQGHDLREYSLCAFGGAGGQHACAIARSLGIGRILLSPFAGVLSAVGIGMTDSKRVAQQSVQCTLNDRAHQDIETALQELTDDVTAQLAHGHIGKGRLSQPTWTVDACFAGQSSLITVSFGDAETMRISFHAAHQRLYGYVHKQRDIEIQVVRCERSIVTAKPDLTPVWHAAPDAPPLMTQSMYCNGKLQDVPVFARRHLAVGRILQGPAIVLDENNTIVLEPDFHAKVLDSGGILATDSGTDQSEERVAQEVDPIQLELFNRRFAAVAERMGATLRRTALSTNVKERLDFSCAIFTPDGDLVVNAPHIPVHLGAMSACVKALMADVGAFAPGDVYVTNDPYRGGSHLNDVTVVSPVHDDTGAHIIFFVASRAHHAEIGGTRPGSMPPDSTCLAEEGVVIRAFPFREGGVLQEARLRTLLTESPFPSRAPDHNLADVAAQTAANQTGIADLQSMAHRFGIDVVQAYMRYIQDSAEAKIRAALARLPDGNQSFCDTLDNGAEIRVAVTVAGDAATIDFSGTGGILPGNLNANRAIVTSAVLYCMRCLIDEDIPLNAGVLAPISIVLPECLLNPFVANDPRESPACVGGNVETSQRIVDCILGALKVVAASQGTMNNVLLGDDSFGYYETIAGGAGAGDGFHGASAVHTHMTNTRITDPEVLESRFPVRLIRFAIRPDSGGRGAYRGGNGVIREMQFLKPLEVSLLTQRRTTAPYGLGGGGNGMPGRNLLKRALSDHQEELPPIVHVLVQSGDRLIIETPGGGGWGKVP